MNDKIEPKLDLENFQKEDLEVNEKEILLKEIIQNQGKVNNSVLKYYQNNNGFDEKIIQILENGANTNKYFMDIMRKQSKNFEPNSSIQQPISLIKDKFYKFKNLCSSFFIKNNLHVIGNIQKPDFYMLGYQTGIWYKKITNMKPIEKIEQLFEKECQKKQVKFSKINHLFSHIYQFIIFQGNQKDVKKISTKFSTHLQQLGVQVENIFSTNPSIISSEDFSKTLNHFIEKKFDIQIDNNEKFTMKNLNDFNDQSQYKFLYNIVLPKIEQEIAISFSFFDKINHLKESNYFLKQLQKFAYKNQLDDEMVLHLLKNNSPHLENLKGYQNLLKNKSSILESANKIKTISEYNQEYMQKFLEIHNYIEQTVMSLDIPSNLKESFQTIINHKTIVKNKKSEPLTLQNIKSKINDFFNNTIYSSKLKIK